MGLDIRWPLGLLFLVTGGMMTVYGLLTRGSSIYEKSLHMDMNLIWGVVLVLFGVIMLLLALTSSYRSSRSDPVRR